MASNEESVTMAEYVAAARKRLADHLASMEPGALAYFERAIAALRHQGAVDGVTQWNEDHLIGFLFASAMIQTGVANAHDAGQLGHDAMEIVAELSMFNERYLVALVPAP